MDIVPSKNTYEFLLDETKLSPEQSKFSFAYFSHASPHHGDLVAAAKFAEYPIEKIQLELQNSAPWIRQAENVYWKSQQVITIREKINEILSHPLDWQDPRFLRIQADVILKTAQALDPNFKQLSQSTNSVQPHATVNIINYGNEKPDAPVQVFSESVSVAPAQSS